MMFDINKEPPSIAAISAMRVQILRRQRIALCSSLLFLLAAFLIAYTEVYVITIAPLHVCLAGLTASIFVMMRYRERTRLLQDISMDNRPEHCSRFVQISKDSTGVRAYHDKLLKMKRRPVIYELIAAIKYKRWESHKAADDGLCINSIPCGSEYNKETGVRS